MSVIPVSLLFFYNDPPTTKIYTLSLHDALPICKALDDPPHAAVANQEYTHVSAESKEQRRSEEHTSELQSPCNLVCRLLLEKKKRNTKNKRHNENAIRKTEECRFRKKINNK